MLACKGIFAKPTMAQVRKGAQRREPQDCGSKASGTLYHEAKMLACKGIFAKPTMARVRKKRTAARAARLQ